VTTTFICVPTATTSGVGQINGGQVYFAGGGGGMANRTGGAGGLGGGGAGMSSANRCASAGGGNGLAYTGGGGGGGSLGSIGGSGVVIVRYPDIYAAATSTNATQYIASNNIFYIFTASGTISF
jgi:hypothetical protein